MQRQSRSGTVFLIVGIALLAASFATDITSTRSAGIALLALGLVLRMGAARRAKDEE